MTTTPLHPIKPTEPADARAGSASGSQGQAQKQAGAKGPQGSDARDEGARTFRSAPETAAVSSTSTGGSSEVLGYLKNIEDLVGKARKTLGSSSRDEVRQATERQSNEGGPAAPKIEAAKPGNALLGTARPGTGFHVDAGPDDRNSLNQI